MARQPPLALHALAREPHSPGGGVSVDERSNLTHSNRAAILLGGKLHEHIRNVFPGRHQKAVWDLGWNVNDVAGPERVPFATFDARAQVLASATPALGIDHLASHYQGALAALHDDNVDHVVVLLGETVRIPIEHSEAVIVVVGQGLSSGMVRANLFGERLISLLQFRRFPEREP
jgi:hypothetical protein